eukprot:gene851-594_t
MASPSLPSSSRTTTTCAAALGVAAACATARCATARFCAGAAAGAAPPAERLRERFPAAAAAAPPAAGDGERPHIAGHFSDGRRLQCTIDALRRGQVAPRQLPLAHVLLAGRRLYCMGTRRLACFHVVWGRTCPYRPIPVVWDGADAGGSALPQGDGCAVDIMGRAV